MNSVPASVEPAEKDTSASKPRGLLSQALRLLISWRTLRLLIGIGLLVFIFRLIDWPTFLDQLRTVNPLYVAGLLVIAVVSLVLSACRWQVLLRADGVQVGLGRLMRYYLISIFFNNYLPPFIGADAVRMLSIRETKSPGVRVVSVLLERGSGLAALVTFGGAAIVLTPSLRQYGILDLLIGAALLAIVGVYMALLFPDLWWWAAGVTRRVPRVYSLLADIADAGRRYRHQTRALITTFAFSFCIQALVVLAFYIRALAFHLDVSLAQTMIIAPAIILLTLIPVSPGGLGTQETFFALTYGMINISTSSALALAVLARAVDLTMGIVGAIVWLRER